MSFNVTQTISSPLQSPRNVSRIVTSPSMNPQSEVDKECWNIYRDRFKYVIFLSVVVQYLLLMIYSILFNIGMLHPVAWAKELLTILCSPLMLTIVTHGYFKLKPLLQEKVYHPTELSKFIKCFPHETSAFVLNFFIGIFTSVLFIRYLNEDFKTFTVKAEDKKFLNEKYAFLLLNGAFIRCYIYFKQHVDGQNIVFPMIHQSKFLQLRRETINVVKSSFVSSLLPMLHFLGFYIIFGGSFCFFLRRVFMLNVEDVSILESFSTILNLRLMVYSWILSSVVWSHTELMNQIIIIFATEPKQFPVEGDTALTLSTALSVAKFAITQQLAAQDLCLLADSPNDNRRKQLYALSNPGSHPHNWNKLVQSSLGVINGFAGELKASIDSISKIRNNNNFSSVNQTYVQFYESKRLAREYNEYNGIRSMAASDLKIEVTVTEPAPSFVDILKQKMMKNKIIFFFFGENECAKLNFLLVQNSQTVEWIVQGVAAIIARSIQEDSYGVVQGDIKQLVKSLLKLKAVLEKVGTVNIVAKDRNFVALKAALRRSLYRIVSEFGRFFDDLLLDPEDVRELNAFATFKEV